MREIYTLRSIETRNNQSQTADSAMYACPCCGYRVFDELPGSYAICPICFWEDDAVQLLNPGFEGGANASSLIKSQRNYKRLGAMEERFIGNVRPSGLGDTRDPHLRPVREIDLANPLVPANLSADEWRPDVLYYWLRNP